MKPSLKAVDKTAYAKSLGYDGQKAVIVQDGKVISHGNKCWLAWCDTMKSKNGS